MNNLMRFARVRMRHVPVVLAACCLLTACSCKEAAPASSPGASAAGTPDTKGSKLFDVLLKGKDGQTVTIGRVTADANCRLHIVSAVPEQKQFLTETLQLINDKLALHVEAPSPEGSPKFADSSRMVDRSSPAFLTELQAFLKQYYDLTLKPVQ